MSLIDPNAQLGPFKSEFLSTVVNQTGNKVYMFLMCEADDGSMITMGFSSPNEIGMAHAQRVADNLAQSLNSLNSIAQFKRAIDNRTD